MWLTHFFFWGGWDMSFGSHVLKLEKRKEMQIIFSKMLHNFKAPSSHPFWRQRSQPHDIILFIDAMKMIPDAVWFIWEMYETSRGEGGWPVWLGEDSYRQLPRHNYYYNACCYYEASACGQVRYILSLMRIWLVFFMEKITWLDNIHSSGCVDYRIALKTCVFVFFLEWIYFWGYYAIPPLLKKDNYNSQYRFNSRLVYGGGGVTDNMLDDNVLGSVDNQENVEAPHDHDHDPRRRRRRDTVLHQPQPNINQVWIGRTTTGYPLTRVSFYFMILLL